MGQYFDVVIVGAGHGGAQAAIGLRKEKFEGSVLVIGAEPELPYERPPLSKEYLAQEKSFDRLLIRSQQFWDSRDIQFKLGEKVEAIDPQAHEILTQNGESIGYGSLIWSAGADPRRLTCPGHDLAGVHVVRHRADIDRMMTELADVQSVVVVGGGYIGLEAAAVLVKLGKSVTILEAQDRVLARVAGVEVSRFFEKHHRAQGVVIKLGAKLEALTGIGRVEAVRLADGSVLPAQMVVVGIGVVPSIGPLLAAGVAGDAALGIDVDAFCRTSAPDIYAIGDCARHANHFAEGSRLRLESVQNATDQANTAVKALLGNPEPYRAVPWFWSTQYDLRLQTVGLSAGHDQVVTRGDPDSHAVSFIYLKEGRVIALDCINAARDYMQGRGLVADRVTADCAALANPEIPLKSLMPEPASNTVG